LQKRKLFIENEIHLQVQALKEQLDAYEKQMLSQLAESCSNAKLNIELFIKQNKSDLDNIKDSSEYLKATAFSYVGQQLKQQQNATKQDNENSKFSNECDDHLAPQRNSVNKCLSNLMQLKKMNKELSAYINELSFYPNVDSTLNSTAIGSLKQIKQINLEENFKVIFQII
jgi:hypothetical protein